MDQSVCKYSSGTGNFGGEGGKKHEIKATVLRGHLFMTIF